MMAYACRECGCDTDWTDELVEAFSEKAVVCDQCCEDYQKSKKSHKAEIVHQARPITELIRPLYLKLITKSFRKKHKMFGTILSIGLLTLAKVSTYWEQAEPVKADYLPSYCKSYMGTDMHLRYSMPVNFMLSFQMLSDPHIIDLGEMKLLRFQFWQSMTCLLRK